MEPAKPPPKLSPAEYAEMVKMKLRNTFPSHLNAMAYVRLFANISLAFHRITLSLFLLHSSKGVIDALNGLLSKSDVKIKNDLLEEQFEADLINKQLKAFDELWQNLELTESVTEMKRKIQEKPTIGANGYWHLNEMFSDQFLIVLNFPQNNGSGQCTCAC